MRQQKNCKKCNDRENNCIMRADGSRENDGDKNIDNTQRHYKCVYYLFLLKFTKN